MSQPKLSKKQWEVLTRMANGYLIHSGIHRGYWVGPPLAVSHEKFRFGVNTLRGLLRKNAIKFTGDGCHALTDTGRAALKARVEEEG